MSRIRLFQPGDEPALGEICVRTGDSGADATGLLRDDDLWAAVWVWPYAAHDPETCAVVETDDGRVAGYCVATPDTDEFERWFADSWWPPYARRWPLTDAAGDREAGILRYAAGRGAASSPFQQAGYPAHLHIDLLPELQGQGFGRRLIGTIADLLRARGVAGVHLTAGADNAGAVAFYPRVGFTALADPTPDARTFGMLLA